MVELTSSEVEKLDKMVTDSINPLEAFQLSIVPGQLLINQSDRTVTAAILAGSDESENQYEVKVFEFDQTKQVLVEKSTINLERDNDWWRGSLDLG